MITQEQALALIENSRRHGYVQGICEVHELLLSYAHQADTVIEANLLEAFGRAIIEMARRT